MYSLFTLMVRNTVLIMRRTNSIVSDSEANLYKYFTSNEGRIFLKLKNEYNQDSRNTIV